MIYKGHVEMLVIFVPCS